MALLIDTSVIIAAERSGGSLLTLRDRLGDLPVAVSAVTASELLHGVHRADGAWRRGHRLRFVETILNDVPVLPFDLPVARTHSRIWADLQSRGEMIGAHDLMIAATALTYDLLLATSNAREFGRVEGLQLSVL